MPAGSAWLDDFTITINEEEKPALTSVREGTSLRISWPASATGYSLQSKASLSGGDWEAVTNGISQQGGVLTILRSTTESAQFFRLAASEATAPAGIYMGNFAGQADNGGFALMVRSNGTAVAVGYNTPQEEGIFISSFTVAANSPFTATTAQGGTVSGAFASGGVNGTFISSEGNPGGFSGDRKPDTGIHAANAGYYTGTYAGQFQGSAFAVLAADGALFFYSIDDPNTPTADGDGGGFGTLNAANSLSGATVPNGLTVTGTLNPTTKALSGSYLFGSTPLGTFSLTRTSTP